MMNSSSAYLSLPPLRVVCIPLLLPLLEVVFTVSLNLTALSSHGFPLPLMLNPPDDRRLAIPHPSMHPLYPPPRLIDFPLCDLPLLSFGIGLPGVIPTAFQRRVPPRSLDGGRFFLYHLTCCSYACSDIVKCPYPLETASIP